MGHIPGRSAEGNLHHGEDGETSVVHIGTRYIIASSSDGHDRLTSKTYDLDENRGAYFANILQYNKQHRQFQPAKEPRQRSGGVFFFIVCLLWQAAMRHSCQCLTIHLCIKNSFFLLCFLVSLNISLHLPNCSSICPEQNIYYLQVWF